MKHLPIDPSRKLSITAELSAPLTSASEPCAWCGMLSSSSCLICLGRICSECVSLFANGKHMCRKCYRDAVEYARGRIAEANEIAVLLDRSRSGTSMWLWRLWAFSNWLGPIRIALWWLRWKLRGHSRNHDTGFCAHASKSWRWTMEDGCTGSICEWCHLLESWCPTELPDLAEVVRMRATGEQDQSWRPTSLVQRYVDAWVDVEKDELASAGRGNI